MKIFLFISLLALGSCSTNPITGKKSFHLMSESQENSQGEKAFRQISQKEKETTNLKLARQISKIGRRLAQVSQRQDFQWEFKTFENAQPNAFCLPGGKVGIYTGIAKYAQNEAGLAAVMGHEIGHALARHGGQRVSQHLGMSVAIMALSVATASKMDPKNRNLMMAALGAGVGVGVLLPFSRSHELEADELGIMLMAKAGYDPKEAVAFWERFGKAKKGKTPPEFLSTHPASETRANRLRQMLPFAEDEYRVAVKKYGKGPKLYY